MGGKHSKSEKKIGGIRGGRQSGDAKRANPSFRRRSKPHVSPHKYASAWATRSPVSVQPLKAELRKVEEDLKLHILQNTKAGRHKTEQGAETKSDTKDGSLDGDTGVQPTFYKQQSELLREEWTAKDRSLEDIKPEYHKAYRMVCLRPEWMRYTKAIHVLKELGDFQEEKEIHAALMDVDFFASTLRRVIMKAYSLPSERDALRQKCLICDQVIYPVLTALWSTFKWRRPYMTLGMQYWLHLGDKDSIIAKLSEVTERGSRCLSVKRLAFDSVVKHADHLLWIKRAENEKKAGGDKGGLDSKAGSDSMTLHEAKAKCKSIFEEYIDQHKLMAFDSAFREPLACYYTDIDRTFYIKDFNNHGLNWWLAGIMCSIGMQMPIIPFLNDTGSGGHCAFWGASGTNKIWNEYKKKENFGRKFHAVLPLKRLRKGSFGKVSHYDFHGQKFAPSPKDFAQALINNGSIRKRWSLYIERLAHFFTVEFFCEKAVSVLMQENTDNPQLLGFRGCMEVIFQHFKRNEGSAEVREESFTEYVYDDNQGSYDYKRFNNILWFAGITKEKVTVSKRTISTAGQREKAQAITFEGDQKLYKRVEELLSSGNTQMAIFGICRTEKLGSAKDILSAIRAVNYAKSY